MAENDSTKESAIYYDKFFKAGKNTKKTTCCGLFSTGFTKVNNMDHGSSDSSDLDRPKAGEYSVSYKGLEKLLADFDRA